MMNPLVLKSAVFLGCCSAVHVTGVIVRRAFYSRKELAEALRKDFKQDPAVYPYPGRARAQKIVEQKR